MCSQQGRTRQAKETEPATAVEMEHPGALRPRPKFKPSWEQSTRVDTPADTAKRTILLAVRIPKLHELLGLE